MAIADPGHIKAVVSAISERGTDRRLLIAIAGQPASGKSTLAEEIVASLNAKAKCTSCLVPMDGFHLHNDILDQRGLRARKGAPDTFDVHGLIACVGRLRRQDEDVYVPTFDRQKDMAIANARCVPTSCQVVVLEGNYLLLDQKPWAQLKDMFDITVRLNLETALLEQRLIQRWLENGLHLEAAHARARSNDLPNALLVSAKSQSADLLLT